MEGGLSSGLKKNDCEVGDGCGTATVCVLVWFVYQFLDTWRSWFKGMRLMFLLLRHLSKGEGAEEQRASFVAKCFSMSVIQGRLPTTMPATYG